MTDTLRSVDVSVKKMVSGFAGAFGEAGERIGNLGKHAKKVFGADAPLALQQTGKAIQGVLGITDSGSKALGQWAESLEGGLKLIGTVVSSIGALIAAGLGPVALAVAGVVAATYGVYKAIEYVSRAMQDSGSSVHEYLRVWVDTFVEIGKVIRDSVGGVLQTVLSGVKTVASYIADIFNNTGLGMTLGIGANAIATVTSGASSAVDTLFAPGKLEEISARNQRGAANGGLVGDWGRSLQDLQGEVDATIDEITQRVRKVLTTPGVSKADAAAAQKELERGYAQYWESIRSLNEQYAKEIEESNQRAMEFMRAEAEGREALRKEQSAAVAAQGDQYRQMAQGTLFDLQEIDVQSGRIGEKVTTMWGQLGNMVASSAMSQTRYVSSAAEGAATGAQTGGGYGAIIGGILGLLTESAGFRQILTALDNLLGTLAEALGKIIAPISELITVLTDVLGPIFEAIASIGQLVRVALYPVIQVLKLLAPVFEVLGTVLQAVIGGLTWLISFGQYDPIKGKFSWEADEQPEARTYVIDTSLDDTAAAMDNVAESANEVAKKFSELLINIPDGYKLSAAIFGATGQATLPTSPTTVAGVKGSARESDSEYLARLAQERRAKIDKMTPTERHQLDWAEYAEYTGVYDRPYREGDPLRPRLENYQAYKTAISSRDERDLRNRYAREEGLTQAESDEWLRDKARSFIGSSDFSSGWGGSLRSSGLTINVNGVTDPTVNAQKVVDVLRRGQYLETGSTYAPIPRGSLG
jgi:hypothetical protein